MEFFHAPVQIISRQKGRSAVAAAAYRSGTRIECTWDGRTHDYTRKQHIVYSQIRPRLPANSMTVPRYGTASSGTNQSGTISWQEKWNWLCPLSFHAKNRSN